MMAAVTAARQGASVTLYEKNEKLGKKLYITGKGRCNLTNASEGDEFLRNVVSNPKFLFSAIRSFSCYDTIEFFEKAGLPLKEERGRRIFPASDKSSDVIKTLEKELRAAGVVIKLNSNIDSLDRIAADAVIIACGGLSYPSTGSTGDGYKFAGGLGHTIRECSPSLTSLIVREAFVKDLEGLSLRNVAVSVKDERVKQVFSDFGEMLFTDEGVSGPVILSASAYLGDKINQAPGKYKLFIDLKPALSYDELERRLLRDFEKNINKEFKNSLKELLPAKLINTLVDLSGISPEKKVNMITKEERRSLLNLLKNFPLTLMKTQGFNRAVITRGGVSVKEINPSTMESRLCPGIYFAGEVIDVDALTGGYNIQIALSTGFVAGRAAAKE